MAKIIEMHSISGKNTTSCNRKFKVRFGQIKIKKFSLFLDRKEEIYIGGKCEICVDFQTMNAI